jgi:hypothetical protein
MESRESNEVAEANNGMDVSKELLTLLREINKKLSREEHSEQSQCSESEEDRKAKSDLFRWYEETHRGRDWISKAGQVPMIVIDTNTSH